MINITANTSNTIYVDASFNPSTSPPTIWQEIDTFLATYWEWIAIGLIIIAILYVSLKPHKEAKKE